MRTEEQTRYAVAFAKAEIRIDRYFAWKRRRFLAQCARAAAAYHYPDHYPEICEQVKYRLSTGKWAYQQERIEELRPRPLPSFFLQPAFRQICTCGAIFESSNCKHLHQEWKKHREENGCRWPFPIPYEYEKETV